MKTALAVIVGLAILGGGFYYLTRTAEAPEVVVETETQTQQGTTTAPTEGVYTVDASKSMVNWSAKKPLIEGYVNSGTIGVKEGSITVSTSTATGSFVIDMDTIKVGLTATKPGKEGALEKHLKTADFFDVAKYPTGTFAIKEVKARADSQTSMMYDIRGDLTMKGKTNEIVFPAKIYVAQDGVLHAEASTEFDRTRWGLTYGSANFFKNLADNAIADMVALSFSIVATKQ